MRIAVIGAGVVGVATAYLLAKAGHDIVLIDAADGPAREASAGNAAQLSWAFGDAMASPSLIRHLPAIVQGRDPAFRIGWRADPDFLAWGLRFLANATARRWWRNTCDILQLADESRQALATLIGETGISFDYRRAGKLHLYASAEALKDARPIVERKKQLGFDQSLLTRGEAEAIEPDLSSYRGPIAGAIWTPGDALGDAAVFSSELTRLMAARHGVEMRFGRKVVGFEAPGGRLTGVRFADCDPLAIEAAVVTAGSMIHTLGAALPEARSIQPVRGYSLTVRWRPGMPKISLTDVKRKLAFATIGTRFRVAGLADVVRRDAGFDPARFDALRSAAKAVLPSCFEDGAEERCWSGERPMTPSSRPIIAPSRRITGLYVNAGHGMLGWTLALGSAGRLRDLVQERSSPA